MASDDSAETDHTETLEAVDAMVARGRRMGFDLSADYLERYRDGVGGVDRWEWDRLLSYEAARDGDAEIKEHFENWLTGELTDDTVGAPFLDLADGESIILGDDPNKRVWWTSNLGLPAFTAGMSFFDPFPDSEETQRRLDFAYALGKAEIESTAQLEFKRRGNFIYVSGYADFSFDQTYDFEPGMLVDLASFFTKGAPTIGNEDMRDLAETGPARTFRTVAHQRRLLTGVIVLTDGKPDPELSWFNWQDVAEEE